MQTSALEWRKALVNRVVDGDTTILRDLRNGQIFRARHIGYNSPETKHPVRGVECYGPEASAVLRRLIEGQMVEYAYDPLAGPKDKYDRDLVHLRFHGKLISHLMIGGGLGFAYRRFQNTYKKTQFEMESAARAANIGLWGACEVFQYEPDPRNYPGVMEYLTQQVGPSTATGEKQVWRADSNRRP